MAEADLQRVKRKQHVERMLTHRIIGVVLGRRRTVAVAATPPVDANDTNAARKERRGERDPVLAGEIWECACGDGSMSRILEQTGQPVHSSDLYDRGYGEAGVDFLHATRTADNIVTNPPYNCAEGFVASGVKHSRRKLALLLRLAFLEGANRANTIFLKMPPARVWVFSERIIFYPSGVEPKGSGTTEIKTAVNSGRAVTAACANLPKLRHRNAVGIGRSSLDLCR